MVGWEVMENRAIVLERDVASDGLWVERRGRMEEPSQEVRMRVLEGFTKQPILAPRELSSWQRNSRSGRKMQDEILSTKLRRCNIPP